MVRQPHKDLPVMWNYGLSVIELEGLDDTVAFDTYADQIVQDYSDSLEKDMLRTTTTVMPTKNSQETTITPLSHIVAAFSEIGKSYAGTTVTAAMVSPYGGTSGDIYGYRSAGASSFDSKVVNGAGAFTVSNLKDAYYGAFAFWNNNTQNKVWIMSQSAIQVIDAARDMPQGRFSLGSEEAYIKWDINGASTMPGQDVGGIGARAAYGIPIINSNNLIFDYPAKTFDPSKNGEAFLIDTNHTFWSVLTPIYSRSSDAIELTGILQRVNALLMRGDFRCNKFTGHAKIANTDPAPSSP
jgi:hypothetical protein